MGAAAYNRGSKCISEQISREGRAAGFDLIELLNAVPKHPNARRPFGPVLFKYDGRNWWALDPIKQFSGFTPASPLRIVTGHSIQSRITRRFDTTCLRAAFT